MLESLSEAIPAEDIPIETNFPWLTNPQLNRLDDSPKKWKKGKKKNRHHKKSAKKHRYAQLAFQYGVLASRYDTLTRMVELAVSAKRQRLDDSLLDDGLVALKPAHDTFTPAR